MTEKSEFGKGLVINLVKFAEHFSHRYLKLAMDYNYFIKNLHQNKNELDNYDRQIREAVEYFDKVVLGKNPDEKISRQIELWANGATDHLYEMYVPKGKSWDRIRKEVELLRTRGLTMGHGYTGKTNWTIDDVFWIMKQTKKIALMVDEKLGLKGDEGEY